jgi:hypothetical protein
MRKNHIRDYAAAAFRFYAQEGGIAPFGVNAWEPGTETPREGGLGQNQGRPVEAAMMDLEAVKRTLTRLDSEKDGGDIRWALWQVYMANHGQKPRKGEVSERATRAAMALHVDERTIYRWLGRAMRIFAEERGLRV